MAGQPWLAYEWLGDIILATANRVAGLIGLELLLLIIGSSVVLALYSLATLRAGNSKAGFVAAALLSILAVLSFSLRPQMLGYLFLILTLIRWSVSAEAGGDNLVFAAAHAFVGQHARFLDCGVGIDFRLLDKRPGGISPGGSGSKSVVAEGTLSLSCVFLLSLLALPVTPYGARVAASPFEFAFSLPLNVAHIQEWQSMPFDTIIGKMFLGLWIGIF